MAKYFCAKVFQEYSEYLRSLALNLGVSEQNMIFKHISCEPLTLEVYIKFEEVETLNKYSKEVVPFIIERWL